MVKTEEMPGRAHRPPRSATGQARVQLDKYHKSHAPVRELADVYTVPASILHGRKHPAAEIHSPARSKPTQSKLKRNLVQKPLKNILSPSNLKIYLTWSKVRSN